jgi:hypothetical protein
MHKLELMSKLESIITSNFEIVQKRQMVKKMIEREPIDELVEALVDLAVIYWHMSRIARVKNENSEKNK